MTQVKAEEAHATMSRAEGVVGNILDACMDGDLPETVWAAAEEARDALSRLRHALWEVKTGEVSS